MGKIVRNARGREHSVGAVPAGSRGGFTRKCGREARHKFRPGTKPAFSQTEVTLEYE